MTPSCEDKWIDYSIIRIYVTCLQAMFFTTVNITGLMSPIASKRIDTCHSIEK